MSGSPVLPIAPVGPLDAAAQSTAAAPPRTGFASHLLDGVDGVNTSLLKADAAANQFALDDSIPPHQVTFALEQARLSLELMLQVRARLVEGYQELMRMQL